MGYPARVARRGAQTAHPGRGRGCVSCSGDGASSRRVSASKRAGGDELATLRRAAAPMTPASTEVGPIVGIGPGPRSAVPAQPAQAVVAEGAWHEIRAKDPSVATTMRLSGHSSWHVDLTPTSSAPHNTHDLGASTPSGYAALQGSSDPPIALAVTLAFSLPTSWVNESIDRFRSGASMLFGSNTLPPRSKPGTAPSTAKAAWVTAPHPTQSISGKSRVSGGGPHPSPGATS